METAYILCLQSSKAVNFSYKRPSPTLNILPLPTSEEARPFCKLENRLYEGGEDGQNIMRLNDSHSERTLVYQWRMT